jgi:hypothetical protein
MGDGSLPVADTAWTGKRGSHGAPRSKSRADSTRVYDSRQVQDWPTPGRYGGPPLQTIRIRASAESQLGPRSLS